MVHHDLLLVKSLTESPETTEPCSYNDPIKLI